MPVIRPKRRQSFLIFRGDLNMKNAIFVTGAALLLAVLLSSPTFAQTGQTASAAPAPAPVETPVETPVTAPVTAPEPAADVAIDALIETASTPEDRAALLRRCAGPPPRPTHAGHAPRVAASEPTPDTPRG